VHCTKTERMRLIVYVFMNVQSNNNNNNNEAFFSVYNIGDLFADIDS
jgi:hypothetical protein